MSGREPLDRVAERVADGATVDWDAVEASCRTPAEREQLNNLRLIAELCRASGELDEDGGAPAAPAAEGVPERWGDLRIVRPLGRGAFGDVYLAYERTLNRPVAVKLLKTGSVPDVELEWRLLTEARALASVTHPNVVTVYGADVRDGRAGFWMEYLEGTTLEDDLALRGTSSAGEAAVTGRDVCLALAAVHRAGLVHRDVKARNIIRDANGRIVLMDFGAGQPLDARDLDRARVVGTPAYLAPEVLAGGRASIASDVYAVGVLLFHLLTGDYPHEASSLAELEARHASGHARALADLRPDLPGPLIQVVERALEADPARRFATAGEMASALSATLDARREGAAGARTSRHTLLWTVALVASLVTVLVLDRATWLRTSARPVRSVGVSDLSVEPGVVVEPAVRSGLTHDIVRELQQRGIEARATSPAVALAGLPLPNLRSSLEVDAILDGRIAGQPDGRPVVRVSLTRTRDDASLLARGFDPAASGWMGVAAEVAGDVARVLGRTPEVGAAHIVPDAAFQQYHRGRVLAEARKEQSLLLAIDAYQAALAIDPAYAQPWVGLADAYIALGVPTFGGLGPLDARRRAKDAVLRALELDRSSAEANATLGFISFFHDWSWSEADRRFRRAIELAPGYAIGHWWYADYLNAMGRTTEAMTHITRARQLEPVSLLFHRDVAWHYFFQRRYGEAIRQLRETLAMDPDYTAAHSLLARALTETGAFAEARQHLAKAGLPRPTGLAFLSYVEAAEGHRDEARAHLKEAIGLSRRTYLAPYHVALAYDKLGDTDTAVDWLWRGHDEQDSTMVNLLTDPRFERLRKDPRVVALIARMEFPGKR